MSNTDDVRAPRYLALYELGLAQGSAMRHLEHAHRMAQLLGLGDTVTEPLGSAMQSVMSAAEATREVVTDAH